MRRVRLRRAVAALLAPPLEAARTTANLSILADGVFDEWGSPVVMDPAAGLSFVVVRTSDGSASRRPVRPD